MFQGFVISDWMGIDKITTPTGGANYSYSVQASVNAGIDMVSQHLVLCSLISSMGREGGDICFSLVFLKCLYLFCGSWSREIYVFLSSLSNVCTCFADHGPI